MVVVLVLTAPIAEPALGNSVTTEDKIKAAFVFNFIKFVSWPDKTFDSADAPIQLCVWGTNALEGALESLRSKTAKNRKIQVLYTQKAGDALGCHLLFIARHNATTLRDIIDQTSEKNILTISDIKGFAQSGGIIGLFRSEDQMRFAINVDAARRSGLRITSQLLKLAKIVSTVER